MNLRLPASFRLGLPLIGLLLMGCATGDFGRPRHSPFGDESNDWIGSEAVGSVGLPASLFELTDDERQLRDLAYPLIAPPYDYNHWTGLLGERAPTREVPRDGLAEAGSYFARLMDAPHQSAASRYAQVTTDVRNDVVRMELFFQTASHVADLDARREKSLGYVHDLTEGEQATALNRINENAMVIAWVCRSVEARIAGYHYALERLVISTPSTMAVEAERAITLLRERLAQCQSRALRSAPIARLAAPRIGRPISK